MTHPQIQFSHLYRKLQIALQGTDKAKLLEVITIDIALLSRPFLDYDTDDGLYTLKKNGAHLLLIFLGQGGIFTTIRPAYPPSKYQYYRSKIGTEFQINYPTQ